MDRITEALLNEFSADRELQCLPLDQRFERLAAYVVVKKQFAGQVDTDEIAVGSGGDTGIDAIAIVVNGQLITDIDAFLDESRDVSTLEVIFIFVQAELSSSFDGSKMGNFQFGVEDFFKSKPVLPRNSAITAAAAIMAAIYDQSGKFRRVNPTCKLFYVTTGKWLSDPALEGRRIAAMAALQETGQFGDVDFQCIGADGLQRLYRQTKIALSREFMFPNRAVIPAIPGIDQAFLGFIPATDFLPLVENEDGEIVKSLFYDNVRDWQAYNDVNIEMRRTISSSIKARFVLMNNGVTIIAQKVIVTSHKFYIEDFQVVNGCQTSHVLHDGKVDLDDTVMVPLRVIGTTDDGVRNTIIQATNRQTEVKSEQFFALTDFAKKLESYFASFTDDRGPLYERRSHQYDA